jgi:hypothetical protein
MCVTCGSPPFAAADYGLVRLLVAEGSESHWVARELVNLAPAKKAVLQTQWKTQQQGDKIVQSLLELMLGTFEFAPSLVLYLLDLAAVEIPRAPQVMESLQGLHTQIAAIPEAQLVSRLRMVAETAPQGWVRQGAAFALLHVAQKPSDVVMIDIYGDNTIVDTELSLGFFGWRASHLGIARQRSWHGRYERAEMFAVVKRAVFVPGCESRAAAIVYKHLDNDDPQRAELLPIVKQGLSHMMQSTWLECALALGDTETLARCVDHSDEILRGAVQRALAKQGTPLFLKRLASAPLADRMSIYSDLLRSGGVTDATLPSLLRAPETVEAKEWPQLIRLLTYKKAAELSADSLLQLGDYLMQMSSLAATDAREHRLKILAWAANDQAHPIPEAMLLAVADSLVTVKGEELAQLRFDDGLSAFLLRADCRHYAFTAVFQVWLADNESGELLARRWLDVHDHLSRQRGGNTAIARSENRVFVTLQTLWETGMQRDQLAKYLGAASTQHRSLEKKQMFVQWGWQRFCDLPEERAALYAAFAGWHDDWMELRNAMPRERRPAGQSAAEHLRLWGNLDRERISTVVDEAMEMANEHEWPDLVVTAFEIVDESTPEQLMMALVGLARVGYQVRNRAEDDDDKSRESHADGESHYRRQAAEKFLQQGRPLLAALQAEKFLDSNLNHRVHDLASIIQTLDEHYLERAKRAQQAADRKEQERLREIEQAQRGEMIKAQVAAAHAEAAARQREMMERAAQMQAQMQAQVQAQMQAMTQAAAAAAQAVAMAPPAMLTAWSMPQPIDAADFEIVLPDLPLKSLLDYARVMVRMSRGGQPMAIFAEHGLDPSAFASCSQQFSMLFGTRPALAQRFAALMAATWM